DCSRAITCILSANLVVHRASRGGPPPAGNDTLTVSPTLQRRTSIYTTPRDSYTTTPVCRVGHRQGSPGVPPAFQLTSDDLGAMAAVREAGGHEGLDEGEPRHASGSAPAQYRRHGRGWQRVHHVAVLGARAATQFPQLSQRRLPAPVA